jgi:hypothetical protein
LHDDIHNFDTVNFRGPLRRLIRFSDGVLGGGGVASKHAYNEVLLPLFHILVIINCNILFGDNKW